MKTLVQTVGLVVLLVVTPIPSNAMISVGDLTKEQAAELGITMKSRKNGDAGVMVWLEFRKEGLLKGFSYCELRMKDAEGKHLVSAMLQPRPVVYGKPADIVSVAFSVAPSQLGNCTFMVVAYGSTRGDVGYRLNVADFIDIAKDAE